MSLDDLLSEAIRLRSNENFIDAENSFIKLIQDYPDNSLVNYHFAWLYDKMGQESNAVPFYEKAIQLGLPDEELKGALLGLGSTYRTLGKYEEAVKILKAGKEKFNNSIEFEVFLSMVYYNLKKYDQSMELLLRILANTSNNEGIQRYKKAILFYSDKLDKIWN